MEFISKTRGLWVKANEVTLDVSSQCMPADTMPSSKALTATCEITQASARPLSELKRVLVFRRRSKQD